MAPTPPQTAAERAKQIAERKREIEAQLDDAWRRLHNMGLELDSPLVDSEGFPRSDIDVRAARLTVHEIRTLKTDHSRIMKEAEEALHALHAEARAQRESREAGQPAATAAASSMDAAESTNAARAFLQVREVSPGSPAASAGLRVGDSILALGSLTAERFRSMQDVARIVQNSLRRKLNVVVRRGGSGEELQLELTPAPWAGNGLVGCLLVPSSG